MAAAPTTTPATTPATTGTRDAPARLELTRRPGTGPDAVLLADHGVDLRGALVVEAGCGSGHNTAHLAGLGARAVGVDLDHARLARARASYGRVPGAEFVHAEAAAYLRGLPARTADAVLSVFGAFSFHPAGPLLRACSHALRPGGLLLITLRASDTTDHVTLLRRTG